MPKLNIDSLPTELRLKLVAVRMKAIQEEVAILMQEKAGTTVISAILAARDRLEKLEKMQEIGQAELAERQRIGEAAE